MTTSTSTDVGLVPETVVRELRKAAATILVGHPRLRIVVFGSRARGDATRGSDIDVGIDAGEPIDSRSMFALRESFDQLPTMLTIDIVDLSTVEPAFRSRALQEGVTVVDRQAA